MLRRRASTAVLSGKCWALHVPREQDMKLSSHPFLSKADALISFHACRLMNFKQYNFGTIRLGSTALTANWWS
jgi:hypothetical protein